MSLQNLGVQEPIDRSPQAGSLPGVDHPVPHRVASSSSTIWNPSPEQILLEEREVPQVFDEDLELKREVQEVVRQTVLAEAMGALLGL